MIPLGLRRAELRTFERTLTQSHSIRVEAHVMNLDHERLGNLTDDIDDGQVNIDADGEPTRSLTMSFLDRRRSTEFDSDSPRDGALYLNRMLQIRYCVRVDALADWVEVPIFTGPVTKMDRAGEYVNVECQGKEILALGAAVEPLTIKKGTPKVDAIRRIMRERGGEANRNMKFPDLATKLPKAVSLGRESVPWQAAQNIAQSMNRILFYDGRGDLRLERFGKNDLFTFDGDAITEPPQIAYDSTEVRNAVLVRGGKPKAKKNEEQPEDDDKKEKERGIRHFKTAPRSHPLSPWRLGREDAPRYLLEVVDNDKIRSGKEAREIADRVLQRRLQQMVDCTFMSLPIPHLEEDDMIRVQYDGIGLSMRLGQASVPFKHDGTMSVGHMRRVSVRRRRKNRR